MARQALLRLHMPVTRIQKFTDAVRRDHYRSPMNSRESGGTFDILKNSRDLLELDWQELSELSILAGRSLRDLNIRQLTGQSVVGVLRQGEFLANPSADFVFAAGDLVALIGLRQESK